MLIDRRSFLRSIGLVGASTVVGCNGAPLEKMHAYLSPPEQIIPGVATWYATVCRACPAGCGIVVKTREARPIKLEGNPEHPVNRGRLCARGQAFIQSLYGPHRVTRPQIRKSGKLAEASWQEVYALVEKKMAEAGSFAMLTGLESGSFSSLAGDLASRFDSGRTLMYEPAALQSMAAAAAMVFGTREVPRIDLSAADHVVSFGADFIDSWVSPVELTGQWAGRHGFGTGRTLRMKYVGPRRNLTANAADGFVPVGADRIGAMVLALAYDLIEKRGSKLAAGELTSIKGLLSDLGPRPTLDAQLEAALEPMVESLASAKSGVVLFGGTEVTRNDATAVHVAALLASHVAGATGKVLVFGQDTWMSKAAPDKMVVDLLDEAAAGDIDVLMINGTNPAYQLPPSAGVADKLGKAKLSVCLAYEHSETTEAADVVFPVHHPLESWGDYSVRAGVTGLMQPVRAPLHPTRHPGDLLIRLARKAGRKVDKRTYKDYVIAHCAGLLGLQGEQPPAPEPAPEPIVTTETAATEPIEPPPPPPPPPLPPEPAKMLAAFEKMLVAGGVFEETKVVDQPTPRGIPAYRLPTVNIVAAKGTLLSVSHSALLGDGRGTVSDWLLEVPDSMTQSAWEVPAEIDAASAKAAGVETGDRVELATEAGRVEATAVVSTDAAPGAICLRMGGGRQYAREQMASGSASTLLAVTMDPESGELARAGVPVEIRKVASGDLVTVSGGVRSEGRKLALAMSEADAKAGKWPLFTRHGEVFPDGHHEAEGHVVPMPHQDREGEQGHDNSHVLVGHPEHRWGLVVDLDLCTGCGACTVACYGENNIPVVGSQRIREGREMSWIRIEKHVFGDDADPTVRFLPVMCQHCAQAPCETVCPVFAPYHTPDGINAQIYNRCIGTRYCANNCPYKVRRFNFFKYPTEGEEKQRLNPDVTVRHRGVMEKCTLCIQRIREATNRAEVEKREIQDGEIVPACVQTCPTGALSFGDFKKQSWAMTRLAKDPRGYRILDYFLNTRPGVVYLRRVEPDTKGD